MHHYQLITHADWGSNPKKRWFATARSEGGSYRLRGPEQLGEVSTFLARNRPANPAARWLAGFDLQIGIPEAYAAAAGIAEFTPWLRGLGRGEWDRFFDVATTAGEISLHRPFYPNNPGGRRQAHLLQGLGVNAMTDLLRRCDRPSETRGAASTLFWTLGAKQVGKGAIIAWRDLILPALSGDAPAAALWPFEGTLEQLRARAPITLCETYPAEAGTHLGITPPGRGWSKRKQGDRAAVGATLLRHADEHGLLLDEDLRARLLDGFGPDADGEDPFDATIGLFGMLEVATGRRTESGPLDLSILSLEGWMLGMGTPLLTRHAT